jgi:hypothetical protein
MLLGFEPGQTFGFVLASLLFSELLCTSTLSFSSLPRATFLFVSSSLLSLPLRFPQSFSLILLLFKPLQTVGFILADFFLSTFLSTWRVRIASFPHIS